MKRGELHLGSVPQAETQQGEEGDHAAGVRRPYLIVSLRSPAATIIACPLSTSADAEGKNALYRVRLLPEDVQTTPTDHPYEWRATVVMADQVRVMSRKRFALASGTSRVGQITKHKMALVEDALMNLLGLAGVARR